MAAKTITLSTGRTIQVTPAPRDLLQQFFAAFKGMGAMSAATAATIAPGLSLIIPFVTCDVDPIVVAATRRKFDQHGMPLPSDDRVVYLMACIETPADAARLGRALAAPYLGNEVLSA